MRTCPACGRRYPVEIEFCEIDGEPLAAVTVATASQTGSEIDPETVVRPRRAQPIAADSGLESPRFTQVRVDIPESGRSSASINVPHAIVAPTGVPDRVYRERPTWPLIAGLGFVVVAASALFIYVWMSQQSDFAAEVSTQISQARVIVADAKARLESLPVESPLRGKLLQLQNWDRELQDLELGRDRTREIAQRSRDIGESARRVGEEARMAGAVVPASPPSVVPAMPSNGNVALPAAPASPTIDPVAPPTDPATTPASAPESEPEKPADPGGSTGQPPPVKPPVPKPADPSVPANPDGGGAQPKPEKPVTTTPPARSLVR
jgi:hypothetical protein